MTVSVSVLDWDHDPTAEGGRPSVYRSGSTIAFPRTHTLSPSTTDTISNVSTVGDDTRTRRGV